MYINKDTQIMIVINYHNPEEAKMIFLADFEEGKVYKEGLGYNETPWMDVDLAKDLAEILREGMKVIAKRNEGISKQMRQKFDELKPFEL